MSKFYQLLDELVDIVKLKKVKKARKRQVLGMAVGMFTSAVVIVSLRQPQNTDWLAKGPMTPGHKDLSCTSCHYEAEGSLRQQLQAKTKFHTGLRHTDADFGLLKVENTACLSCHDRQDDHHPVFRFNEPRFAELRKSLDATQCSTCHTEHNGTLASVPKTSICLSCHQDLKIKKDPLEISHEQLIANHLGNTCMQCHDYHGNHQMALRTSIKDTIPVQAILRYLNIGTDPYSKQKIVKASTNNGK